MWVNVWAGSLPHLLHGPAAGWRQCWGCTPGASGCEGTPGRPRARGSHPVGCDLRGPWPPLDAAWCSAQVAKASKCGRSGARASGEAGGRRGSVTGTASQEPGGSVRSPGKPSQQGLRGHQVVSPARPLTGRCRGARGHSGPSGVLLRFLVKAQICHIFVPSTRPFSGETQAPASCSSNNSGVRGSEARLGRGGAVTPTLQVPLVSRGLHSREASSSVLPTGSVPVLGSPQRSTRSSQESRCGWAGWRQAGQRSCAVATEPSRARGADRQMDRGSDHGAPAAKCLWLTP